MMSQTSDGEFSPKIVNMRLSVSLSFLYTVYFHRVIFDSLKDTGGNLGCISLSYKKINFKLFKVIPLFVYFLLYLLIICY